MPLTERIRSKLEAERNWLIQQALFQTDWDRGCSAVAQSLDAWVEEYATQLLGAGITEAVRERCRVRVWETWAYHWEQAARRSSTGQADGMAVAEAARAGIRPGHSHPMGGDPLRDGVLAEACLAGLNPALGRFFTEYQATFDQEARRVFHREPNDDLWQDLFVKLVGTVPGEGKLTEFKGYSSLRAWLRPVARHFAMDYCRLEQIRKAAERRAALLRTPEIASSNPLGWDETLAWCRDQVAQALALLEERDRLLLLLRYRSGWSGSAIAGLLKVNPGHFSRLLGQATERFRLQLEGAWRQLFEEYGPSTVAYFLFRGLDEAHFATTESDTHRSPIQEESAMSTARDKPKKKTGRANPAKTRKTPMTERAKPPAGAEKEPGSRPARKILAPSPAAAEAGREQEGRPGPRGTPAPLRATEAVAKVDSEELERFLPQSIVEVNPDDSPEELFTRLEGQPTEQRPAVICLDAREEVGLERVLRWLAKLDAVVSEQRESETENLYEPHRVIFLSEEIPEPSSDWKSRPDLDWIRADDAPGGVIALYHQHLRDDLSDFVNGDLRGFFPAAPAGPVTPLLDLLPASKREALQARLRELQDREDEA